MRSILMLAFGTPHHTEAMTGDGMLFIGAKQGFFLQKKPYLQNDGYHDSLSFSAPTTCAANAGVSIMPTNSPL